MSNIIDFSVIDELKDVGGDEFVAELVTMFLEQSEDIMKDIKTFSQSKDAVSLSKSAHKLKGSCLNLGAKDMGTMCQTIEHQSRENNLTDIDSNLEQLNDLYIQTSTELKKLL